MRLIVYNPAGGAALRAPRLRAAIRELESQPGPHTLVATEADDMIGPVARALDRHPNAAVVIACGGDGTVSACAAAVGDRDIPIGIVPTGTSNVLTYELGLPANAVDAARALSRPTRRVVFRTWRVNGRLMLLQLGVGFDGQLMWRTPRRLKRVLGFGGVVLNALRTGVSFDYPEMRVSGVAADGTTRTAVVTSVMVANAKRWAGAAVTIPDAEPDDDLLDVLLLTYRTFAQLARFWISILLPGVPHLRLPYVEHARMRRLRIEALQGMIPAHLDGEPVLTTPLDVEPLGRVHLLAPA